MRDGGFYAKSKKRWILESACRECRVSMLKYKNAGAYESRVCNMECFLALLRGGSAKPGKGSPRQWAHAQFLRIVGTFSYLTRYYAQYQLRHIVWGIIWWGIFLNILQDIFWNCSNFFTDATNKMQCIVKKMFRSVSENCLHLFPLNLWTFVERGQISGVGKDLRDCFFSHVKTTAIKRSFSVM